MRAAYLVLAGSLVLAGCLGATVGTEDAQTLREQAEERATERATNPQLVGVFGIEPPYHVKANASEGWIYLDETPGDGKAPGWAFLFRGSDRSGAVVVSDKIGVVAEFWEETDEGEEDAPAIQGWSVGSEQAASALAEHPDWPELDQSWALAWELEMDEGTPTWEAEAFRPLNEADGSFEGEVDASTGEVVEVEREEETPFGGTTPGMQGGCSTTGNAGRVSPAESVEAAVAVEGAPGVIYVQVSYSGLGPLDLTLEHEGEAVWGETVTASGGGNLQQTVEDLGDGEYLLTASTQAGAFMGVEMQLTATWGEGGAGCVADGESGDRVRAWAWAQLFELYGWR